MEVKGYRVKAASQSFSLYDCDAILDFIEGLKGEEVIVIETDGSVEEGVMIHFFVREDGEQLNLDIRS